MKIFNMILWGLDGALLLTAVALVVLIYKGNKPSAPASAKIKP